jgi:hypothetical protein
MVPLAVTSTNRMIQGLGPKRWKLLRRLAYLAAAGALHYYMLVKADTTDDACGDGEEGRTGARAESRLISPPTPPFPPECSRLRSRVERIVGADPSSSQS